MTAARLHLLAFLGLAGALSSSATGALHEPSRTSRRLGPSVPSSSTWTTCTGVLPVCRDGEKPTLDNADGSTTSRRCRPNVFKRPTIRISAQNWESALLNSWVIQILLMEQMQYPVEFVDASPPENARSVDFYSWDKDRSVSVDAFKGPTYDWEGLDAAAADFTCGAAKRQGKHCAHIMSEVWSAQNEASIEAGMAKGTLEKMGQLGVAGRIGLYAPTMAAESLGDLTFRSLQSADVTRHFGVPQTFNASCGAAAAAAGTLCHFAANNRTHGHSLLGRYFIHTLDPAVRDAARAAGVSEAELGADPTWTNASSTSSSAAAFTSIDAVYGGRLAPRPDGRAHSAEVPCSWSTFYPLQERHLNVASVQYAYPQMQELWDLMGYNLGRVDTSRPKEEWKDDPHFLPVIGWWWSPEALQRRYQWQGAHWQMEIVRMRPWTEECERIRQTHFLSLKSQHCINGTFQLPPDWLQNCGGAATNCEDAGCDYREEVLEKVAATTLSTNVPDASLFLHRIELVHNVHGEWLGQLYFNETLRRVQPDENRRWRSLICDWVNANKHNGSRWRNWLPELDAMNVGCRSSWRDPLCDGHGTCEAGPEGDGVGQCSCEKGWAGYLCQSIDPGELPTFLSVSNLTTFNWDDLDPEDQQAMLMAEKSTKSFRISMGTGNVKPLKLFTSGRTIHIVVVVLGSVGILVSVAFILFQMRYRRLSVMQPASPLFMMIIGAGTLLIYMSFMLHSRIDARRVLEGWRCSLGIWFFHIGFSTTFGAMFAKTWRIHKIFNNKRMRTVVITDAALLRKIGALVLTQIVVLFAWQLWPGGAPQIIGVVEEGPSAFEVWFTCGSTASATAFHWILFIIDIVVICYGCMLVYETRHVHDVFKDRWIGVTIWNVVVFALIAMTILFGFQGTLNPDQAFAVGSLTAFVGTFTSILLLFVPKIFLINGNMTLEK